MSSPSSAHIRPSALPSNFTAQFRGILAANCRSQGAKVDHYATLFKPLFPTVKDAMEQQGELKQIIAQKIFDNDDLLVYNTERSKLDPGAQLIKQALQTRVNKVWRSILRSAYDVVSFSVFFFIHYLS